MVNDLNMGYKEIENARVEYDERARNVNDDFQIRGSLRNPIKRIRKSRLYIWNFFRQAPSKERFLDVGCGNGLFTVPLTDLFDFVVGVDISKVMLKRCKEKKANLDLVLASSTDLPFINGVFDGVMSNSVLQLMSQTNIMKTLSEISRTAKKKCIVFLGFWNTSNSPAKFVMDIMKSMGFKTKPAFRYYFRFTGLSFTKYVKLHCFRIRFKYQS
jgi:ubiquinone/menaquinone biosynthesis C-methylase UbiE